VSSQLAGFLQQKVAKGWPRAVDHSKLFEEWQQQYPTGRNALFLSLPTCLEGTHGSAALRGIQQVGSGGGGDAVFPRLSARGQGDVPRTDDVVESGGANKRQIPPAESVQAEKFEREVERAGAPVPQRVHLELGTPPWSVACTFCEI
jgi:hypothetical protein